jgi:hypothetical protein
VEIIDFVRGRWLAVAITAPVLSGVIAFVVFSSTQTEQFEATGRVAVGQVAPDDPTADDLEVYVESFLAQLEATETLRDVADVVGGTTGAADGALSATEVGADIVEVTFEDASRDDAEAGLDAATRSALDGLARRDVERLDATIAAIQVRVDELTGQLRDVQDLAGTSDVSADLASLSQQILIVRNQIASTIDPALASSYNVLLATLEQERNQLRGAVDEFERLRAALSQANEDLGEAELRRISAQARVDTIAGGPVVASVRVGEVSDVAQVARGTLTAMVGALLAVFVALFVLHQRSKGDGQQQHEHEHGQDGQRGGPPRPKVEAKPPAPPSVRPGTKRGGTSTVG